MSTQFLWLITGGILVGTTLAFVVSYFISNIILEDVIYFIIVLCGVYLSFEIAEVALGSNGIISVSFYGIFMAKLGRYLFNPRLFDFMTKVWHVMYFGVESILYTVSGINLGIVVIENSDKLIKVDLFKVIVFYFI